MLQNKTNITGFAVTVNIALQESLQIYTITSKNNNIFK